MITLKQWLLLILFVWFGSNAYAQPTIFDPTNVKWENTKTAQTLSNIGVGVGIGLDVYDVFKSVDKKHASIILAERYVVVAGVTEIVKRVVHRTRPDKSDNKSFWSEHTAFAGTKFYIAIPVGYLRMAGDKHYLTDVAAGFGFRQLINKVIK